MSRRPLPERTKTNRPGPALAVGSLEPQAERPRARAMAVSGGSSRRMGFMSEKLACRASLAGSPSAVQNKDDNPQESRWIKFPFAAFRSEERRVGKEGRSRWSPYH